MMRALLSQWKCIGGKDVHWGRMAVMVVWRREQAEKAKNMPVASARKELSSERKPGVMPEPFKMIVPFGPARE